MTTVLTVRIEPALLTKAEARAARLGLDRAKYVRSLIESDLQAERTREKRFASEDLVGAFALGAGSATNERVRENLRKRAKCEGDR